MKTSKKLFNSIQVPPKTAIGREARFKVLAMRATGKTYDDIKKETGYSSATISRIFKNNPEAKEEIEKQQIEKRLKIEERIIIKASELIEKKLGRIDRNDKKLDEIRLNELSSTIKDIQQKQLLDEGKPTTISQSLSGLSLDQLRLRVLESAKLIKDGDSIELLRATFTESETLPPNSADLTVESND